MPTKKILPQDLVVGSRFRFDDDAPSDSLTVTWVERPVPGLTNIDCGPHHHFAFQDDDDCLVALPEVYTGL